MSFLGSPIRHITNVARRQFAAWVESTYVSIRHQTDGVERASSTEKLIDTNSLI